MAAVIRRRFTHQFFAGVAGFVFGVSLVTAVAWATVGVKPSAIFAHTEYSKA